MNSMLYTITFVVYVLFCLLYVKTLVLKALSLCLYLIIFRVFRIRASLLSPRLRENGIIPDLL